MKTYTTTVESREELYITLPEELGLVPGTKLTWEETADGTFTVKPFVSIEVELDDATFMAISKKAHERDITFNDMCMEILQERIAQNQTPSSPFTTDGEESKQIQNVW